MARLRLRVAVVVLAAGVACSGSGSTGVRPTVTGVTPPATSFRTAATVTIAGANLTRDDQVAFGPLSARVLAATGDALHVEVPAAKKPERVTVTVSSAAGDAKGSTPFVFRGMAPEELRFLDRGALPVTGTRLAAGDVDGDGKLDLVVATDAHLTLLAGDGKLGFTDEADLDQASQAMVLASLGGKGETILCGGTGLDLVKLADGALASTPVDGSPAVVALATTRLATGADDVFALTRGDSGFSLARLHPGEHPTLSPVFDLGAFQPVSLVLADLNGDGAIDALVGGASEGPRLLLGDGHGAFADAPAGTFPASIGGAARVADLDVDGKPDVVVATAGGDLAFRNAGAVFVDRTEELFGRVDTRAALEADLDADAAIDRVGERGSLVVLRNDGTGRFFDYTAQAIPAPLRSAAPLVAVDLDGDEDPELVVRAPDGGLHLLENWAPKAWVDTDGDGVPDSADNCPTKPNPDQANRDANLFSCVAPDCSTEPGCRFAKGATHAYLACDGPVTFADAQAFCASRGTRLALGTDADENGAIAQLLGTAGWIDLNDLAQTSHFVRTDGSDPTFTDWHDGEPNNPGMEDCGEIYPDGTWNNLACSATLPFVCEDGLTRTGDTFGDACDDCPLLPDQDQKNECGASP